MVHIDDNIQQRIKDAASIVDVVTQDLGVTLHRRGAEYEGLCPFHEDRHLGSFKVNESKNIATCFSCCKTWDPIAALMEGANMDYQSALRHLAARYNIYIDDEPAPKVTPAKPRPAAPEKPMIYWNIHTVKPYLNHEDENPLLTYLFGLPLNDEDKARLMLMARDGYLVGTGTQGTTKGWTVWWQIDEQKRVRTGKVMAYKADGHRDKERKYSFDFFHSILARAGRWNPETHQVKTCLFGLHLVDLFPDAEVCIVESEKSALICSAFCDPNERIWMATAGKSQLKKSRLQPLIDRNRYIVLYPDYDGYDEWEAACKQIGYERISVSNQVRKLWTVKDGPKADIADIMLRLVEGIKESPAEVAARRLGRPDKVDVLAMMMDKLNLEIVQ